ncbi:MAG: hypothetical protein CVV13_00865 [Gammaproteobacteria bacterium HGW-Gammaproteobacteria-3]|nr:MAG: hypothetical protein CVV13_00865 [Gammaproteobacteria bacterium HGW-Gammaproteobacteria-3]
MFCRAEMNKQTGWPVIDTLVAIMALAGVSGCTIPFMDGYGENKLTQEEFGVYVEKVFKRQNQISSEVMLLGYDENSEKFQAVLKAEQKMQKICAPLNEYAALESDGLPVGLLLKRRVEKSAVACDKAAKKVQRSLRALNK